MGTFLGIPGTMGSNSLADFVIVGLQFRDISLLRDMKCTESYGLWPGIGKYFIVAEFRYRGVRLYSQKNQVSKQFPSL